MGLLSAAGRWKKSWDQLLATLRGESAVLTFGPNLGPASSSDLGNTSRQLAAYIGWVYAAVNAITNRVASVPMRLYRAGTDEEIETHPLIDLLTRPNPFMVGQFFQVLIQTHLDLTGMAFIHVVANGLGQPAELWPLDPASLIRIESGATNEDWISAFVFRASDGGETTYSPDEVLYLRYPHPTALLYGASPIQAAAYAYDIDKAIRVYQRNFFQNSARPDVVLYSDQSLGWDYAERIKSQWKQKHQGVDRAFEPAVLGKGLKAQILTVSAKDAQFMELAGWTKDNILAAYNVPEGKLGLVKDVNRANALGIDITFNSECIKPRLDLWDATLNAFLVPRFGGDLVIKHDNPIPRDIEFEHRRQVERLDRGVISINEARAKDGLEPIEGGDIPTLDGGRLPLTMVGLQPTKQDQGKTSSIKEAAQKIGPTPEEHEAEIMRRADHFETGLVSLFKDLKIDSLAKLSIGYPKVEARFAGWSRTKVETTLKADPPTDLVFAVDDYHDRAWLDLYEPNLRGTMYDRGSRIVAQMGLDIDFGLTSPQAVEFLTSREFLMVETLQDIRDGALSIVQQGITDGLSTDQVAQQITDFFEGLSTPPELGAGMARSRRIAVTETNAALNAADQVARDQAEDEGHVVFKQWHAQPNARPTHAAASVRYGSKGVPNSDPFIVGGARCMAPGQCGVAREDINCHCWTTSVLT